MIRNLVRRLRADDGLTLPNVIIGCVIMLITTGVVVYGIATFITVQRSTLEASAKASAYQSTDALWKFTVANAEAAKVTDERRVQFTLIENEVCREEAWEVVNRDGDSTIQLTTKRYPSALQNPTRCTGTAQQETSVLVPSAGETARFNYWNIAGRDLTFTSGAATSIEEAKPAGVDQRDWDSLVPTSFALDAAMTTGPVNLLTDVTESAVGSWTIQQGTGVLVPGKSPLYTVTPTSSSGATVHVQMSDPVPVFEGSVYTAAVTITSNDPNSITVSVQDSTGDAFLCDGQCTSAQTITPGTKTIVLDGTAAKSAKAHLVVKSSTNAAFTIDRVAITSGGYPDLEPRNIDRTAHSAFIFHSRQDAPLLTHDIGTASGGATFVTPNAKDLSDAG